MKMLSPELGLFAVASTAPADSTNELQRQFKIGRECPFIGGFRSVAASRKSASFGHPRVRYSITRSARKRSEAGNSTPISRAKRALIVTW